MNRTRAALLAGAARAVETSGTKITMAQVATAAGVAKATLYNHFRTREAVLAALLCDQVTAIVDEQAGKPLETALADAAAAIARHPVRRGLARVEPGTLAALGCIDLSAEAWQYARAGVAAALARGRPRRHRHRVALAGVLPALARRRVGDRRRRRRAGRPGCQCSRPRGPGRRRPAGLIAARPGHPRPVGLGARRLPRLDRRPVARHPCGRRRRKAMQMAKPNPVVRGWKYMSVWFGAKIDEKADPKIQIEQAVQEAQRQHQALTQQAAAVIGNQRQLEMQLDRQLNTVENLQAQARQALVLADQARADGDSAKAARVRATAQALANQLVTAESAVEDLKTLHDQSLQAAVQAREAVQDQRRDPAAAAGRARHAVSQLEQAKMQESGRGVAAAAQRHRRAGQHPDAGRGARQDRAALRRGAGPGRAGAGLQPAARVLEVQRATTDLKGAARLDRAAGLAGRASRRPALGTDRAGRRAQPTDPSPAAPVATTTRSRRADASLTLSIETSGWQVGHQ